MMMMIYKRKINLMTHRAVTRSAKSVCVEVCSERVSNGDANGEKPIPSFITLVMNGGISVSAVLKIGR